MTPGLRTGDAHLASPVPIVLAAERLQPAADVVARADFGAEDDAAAGRPDPFVELVVLVRRVRLVEEAHALECAAPEGAEKDGRHLLLVFGVAESGATDPERRAHGAGDRAAGLAVADRLLTTADVVGARGERAASTDRRRWFGRPFGVAVLTGDDVAPARQDGPIQPGRLHPTRVVDEAHAWIPCGDRTDDVSGAIVEPPSATITSYRSDG